MISDVGAIMLGMFGIANMGFWLGYFAGKARWKDAEPVPTLADM